MKTSNFGSKLQNKMDTLVRKIQKYVLHMEILVFVLYGFQLLKNTKPKKWFAQIFVYNIYIYIYTYIFINEV